MSVARPERNVCPACGEAIEGAALLALGRSWHPRHFRCAGCGETIASERFVVHGDQPWHQDCYRETILPRCGYCGTPLDGRYRVDAWGTPFCLAHEEEWPQCWFCNRLIPPDDEVTGAEVDGRPRCRTCEDMAIEDDHTAGVILPELVDWLQAEGVTLEQAVTFRVRVVSRAELQGRDRKGPDYLGMAHVRRSGSSATPTMIEIHLLRGIPSPLFEAVGIHELGHAWLACRLVRGLPDWAEEGFCELLAHRWLTQMNTEDTRVYAQRIVDNTNPVYGDGYRRMRKLSGVMGFGRLIDHLMTQRKLPASA